MSCNNIKRVNFLISKYIFRSMPISNNFLEKKLYIITSSEKKIFDLTLVALEVLQKTECILISKKFDQQLIKNLKKINTELIFEEDLIQNREITQKILKLFEKHKSISHLRRSTEVFYNHLIFEYSELREKVNIILVPTVLEVISSLNKLNLPLTDRRKNSSVNFIEDDTIKKVSLALNDAYYEKIIIKLEDQIQFEKIYKKLNIKNKNYNVIYICSDKKLNQNNKNFKEK
ncbi:MAG: hypothetical protein CMP37_02090, partial [Rickettsiales bacterium]|nr:hypothetical protein [Rickettsiales bacterium]